jgi:AMP nucleosidase
MTFEIAATPQEAVDRLELLYEQARTALRHDLQRFFQTAQPPTLEERALYRYPTLRVTYEPSKLPAATRRGYAKFSMPGVYSTTVTQPAEFRAYLLDQLQPLVEEYGATIETGVSNQEIPYPYALDGGDELGRGTVTAADLARYFPTPLLALVGDEIADGTFEIVEGEPRPLSLFDAVRVDYSLRRLVHYTGTDWRAVQPWVLLTNYHRYVDQFVRLALAEIGPARRRRWSRRAASASTATASTSAPPNG